MKVLFTEIQTSTSPQESKKKHPTSKNYPTETPTIIQIGCVSYNLETKENEDALSIKIKFNLASADPQHLRTTNYPNLKDYWGTNGVTPDAAVVSFNSFIKRYSTYTHQNKPNAAPRAIIAGHGVRSYTHPVICEWLRGVNLHYKAGYNLPFVFNPAIDTLEMANTLSTINGLEYFKSNSLYSLCKYFEIGNISSDMAILDKLQHTITLYEKILELFNKT